MDHSGSSSEDRPRPSDSNFGPFGESALQNPSNLSLGKTTQWNAETSASDPEDPEKLRALSEEDLEILEATHDAELVTLRATHDVERVSAVNALKEDIEFLQEALKPTSTKLPSTNPERTGGLKSLKGSLDADRVGAAKVSEGSRLNQRNMDAQTQCQTQDEPQGSEAREVQELRESREERARDSKMNRLSGRPTGAFDPTNTEDLKALKEALDSKETVPKTEIKSDGRPRDPLADTESRRLRVVSPPRHDVENKPVKSILRRPRETFPDDPTPTSEGVAPVKDAKKDRIPPNARWTKISRNLVNPEALESGKERFEAREDFVIVLRVLSRDEVQWYAKVTERIRGKGETLNIDTVAKVTIL